MQTPPRGSRRAFTLAELVVVIIIIGLLASMAIPRLSRGSEGAADSVLVADLRAVRHAILLYCLEHDTTLPGPTADNFVTQLTQFTSRTGGTSATKSGTYSFGPYLGDMPACPLGPNAGSPDVLIDSANSPPEANTVGGEGWVYNPNTGEFIANIPDAQLVDIKLPLGGNDLLKGGALK